MLSFEHVNRLGLATSMALFSLFAVGFAYDSEYTVTFYSPINYVWVGLRTPYQPFRTSWPWSGLFGATVLMWGCIISLAKGPHS